jgi:hypothetical protein
VVSITWGLSVATREVEVGARGAKAVLDTEDDDGETPKGSQGVDGADT